MPRKKEAPNRKDGLYEVKITLGKDRNGKPIRKSFYSSVSKTDAKKHAEAYKLEQELAARENRPFIDKDVSFEKWALKWLETYKHGNVKEATYITSYENPVKLHLIPYLGPLPLTAIKPLDIRECLNKQNFLSASVLSKMKMCLDGIFESAIDNDLCFKNPTKNETYTSTRKKNEKKVYSDDQIAFVENAALLVRPEVVLLLNTGLRRGELLGLKWSDIDFDQHTLSVNRSIADTDQGPQESPPKWDSYRTIPLCSTAITLLANLQRDSNYIFPLQSGAPQSPNSWSQKLKRFMQKLPTDIPRLTAHELRHTYGTYLRRHGVDIYTIQKILGHRDIKMTSEIYVHNEVNVLKEALNKVHLS